MLVANKDLCHLGLAFSRDQVASTPLPRPRNKHSNMHIGLTRRAQRWRPDEEWCGLFLRAPPHIGQASKVYVQDKVREAASLVWQALQVRTFPLP